MQIYAVCVNSLFSVQFCEFQIQRGSVLLARSAQVGVS
jgi:hypothetical protein